MTPRRVARSERDRGLKISKPRFRRRLAAAICSCLGFVRAQYQARVRLPHPTAMINPTGNASRDLTDRHKEIMNFSLNAHLNGVQKVVSSNLTAPTISSDNASIPRDFPEALRVNRVPLTTTT